MCRGVEPAETIGDGGLDARVGRPEARIAGEETLGPGLVPGASERVLLGRLVLAQGKPEW